MSQRALSRGAALAARGRLNLLRGPRSLLASALPRTVALPRAPPSLARSLSGTGSWRSLGEEGGGGGKDRDWPKPKAVVFDVGGVLAASPYPIFHRFEDTQCLVRDSVVQAVQRSAQKDDGAFARMERGELSTEAFCEPFAREYTDLTGVPLTAEQVGELMEELGAFAHDFLMNPEPVAAIEWLKGRGVKTAILTNNFVREDGTTVFPTSCHNADVTVQSALEGVKKPDKVIFERTLERLGVAAAETLFLDDLGGNVKAARHLGINTIKVSDVPASIQTMKVIVEGRGSYSGEVPGTSEISSKLLFPVPPLVQYLRQKHGLFQNAPPVIRQFKHGQSNPTYYISYGGAEMVLRKKPPGKLLPSAHAVEREFRVMKAVQECGVPIPVLMSLCEDESVVGTPFYLMQYLPGRVLKDPSLTSTEKEERGSIYSEMVRVLAAIHSVDIERTHLQDFGKQGNYVGRQVSRWSQQYEASKTHDIPAMGKLTEWLVSNLPTTEECTVVHGDFRLDNLIFAPDSPRVLGVLDWELSTLGNPLSDLAYCCIPYHMEPNLPHLKGMVGYSLAELGIPSQEDLVQQYCRLRGIPSLPNLDLYLAFTFFRGAAILQGVYKRSLQAQSSADNARAVGLMAEEMAKKGWHFAQKQSTGANDRGNPTGGRAYSTGANDRGNPTGGRTYSTSANDRGNPTGGRAYSTSARMLSSCSSDNTAALITGDVPSFPPRLRQLQEQVASFMAEEVGPAEPTFLAHQASAERWRPHPLMEELKAKARGRGLWNLFLPLESDEGGRYGAGLTNLEYAHLAELMGRSLFGSEPFNCSPPDTGNMEVLVKYATEEQKVRWLSPLLEGKVRSCFAMTEPAVASSDASNIRSSIERDGDNYVLNGRKWWISGAVDPRCSICIFMGQTDPQAPRHKQQSMILVPMETPGVEVLRPLTVFGYDDAPSGHAEMEFSNVIVPKENLLLGEGRGFEIAQGRLGPGRIHHCMRLIGMAEHALDLMRSRVKERVAFGKPLAEQGTIVSDIALSRVELEQARLLTLKAAHLMDTVGNKASRKEIAMIKVVAPRMAQTVIDRAMQAHGAMGLSGDRPMASLFAWARILRLADGPDEVHIASIGKMELKGK